MVASQIFSEVQYEKTVCSFNFRFGCFSDAWNISCSESVF